MKKPRKLSFWDFGGILLAALTWTLASLAWNEVGRLQCASEPQPSMCQSTELNPLDRQSIYLNDKTADHTSDWTQYSMGAVAAIAPLSVYLFYFPPPIALGFAARDFVILVQVALTNGALNEVVRLTVQRPRPYVLSGPPAYARDQANYNSFYSGHTSFSAAMAIGLFLVLLGRGVSRGLSLSFLSIGLLLTFTTALFRILGGRHYMSDVLVGLCLGSLVAYLVYRFHQSDFRLKEKSPEKKAVVGSEASPSAS